MSFHFQKFQKSALRKYPTNSLIFSLAKVSSKDQKEVLKAMCVAQPLQPKFVSTNSGERCLRVNVSQYPPNQQYSLIFRLNNTTKHDWGAGVRIVTQSPAVQLQTYRLQLLRGYTSTELVINFMIPPVMPKSEEIIDF